MMDHFMEEVVVKRNRAVQNILYVAATIIMVICALIRETLGNATIWGKEIAFLANYKVSALAGVFGGYLVLAVVLAAINKITGLHHHNAQEDK